ncbi:ABC transporter permease subunit [Corynebacterium sanguinis]|uniref:ABC transporter permease n=1 Tax=Corynebacterium sanguinis TaxID=2594913 RepID=UPI00119D19E4|nr:ABC transporter permease subunit [Corynebacterium sanguinis]MCT1412396.1 ABC transporter permease subunit [Corynebacterium sanguinis]MCT1426510.1 ABC transporter permease subunit [Corynebacterium sanguinis]MCT1445338.1 ABC transporter permease subunit [Corynebacterium sanguinis]MCT1491957.1 ABC transporter permease subunit [Corynebacterium sanguinis]MCT1597439.1 ABC transporter permease subunit [Corynebacterium sanguinis]
MNWTWLGSNAGRIGSLAIDHLLLALPAIFAAFFIAVPIGWLAHRAGRVRETLVVATSLIYVVPSLAMFVLLPLVLGTSVLSPLNVVVAMTLYGIALMVRSATDSFGSVPADVHQSAIATGYSPLRRILRVELPLAGPGLLAGVRVVAASTISLVSVGALIGVQSLGTLFTEGFQRSFPTQIIAGLIGTILLAVLVDALLVAFGRVTMPWTRKAGLK